MLNRTSQLTALALSLVVIPAAAYTGRLDRVVELEPATVVPVLTPLSLDTTDGIHPTPPSSGDDDDDDGLECFLECDEGYLECNTRTESSGDLCADSAAYAYFNGLIDYKTYATLVQGCDFGAAVGGTICDSLFAQCLSGCIH